MSHNKTYVGSCLNKRRFTEECGPRCGVWQSSALTDSCCFKADTKPERKDLGERTLFGMMTGFGFTMCLSCTYICIDQKVEKERNCFRQDTNKKRDFSTEWSCKKKHKNTLLKIMHKNTGCDDNMLGCSTVRTRGCNQFCFFLLVLFNL